MEELKRLTRSRTNRMIAGVCGGLGEYFSLDPVLFRILFIALTILGGAGILLYIVLVLVIPEAGQDGTRMNVEHVVEEVKDGVQHTAQELKANPRWFDNRRNLVGLFIVLVGAIALLNQFAPFRWLSWNIFWPFVVIVVGFVIMTKRH